MFFTTLNALPDNRFWMVTLPRILLSGQTKGRWTCRVESRLRMRRAFLAAIAAVLTAGLATELSFARQQPSFRSSVDLIALDVQVVDGEGRPVRQLGPERFDVEIGGHRRRVVSTDFVDHAD